MVVHGNFTPNLLYLVRDPWRLGEPLEATQVHHAGRQFSSGVAVCSACAAAGNSGHCAALVATESKQSLEGVTAIVEMRNSLAG
jgi:hypothetical protein